MDLTPAQCSPFALVHLISQNLRALHSRCPEAPATALRNLSELLVEIDRRDVHTASLLRMMDDSILASNSDYIVRTFPQGALV